MQVVITAVGPDRPGIASDFTGHVHAAGANLAARIRQAGGDVEHITYPKRGHGGVVIALAWPNQWMAPALADVTDYFNRH